MPAADVQNTVVGKIGNIYVPPFGTAPPFTTPPDATVDVNAAIPPAWQAYNLGFLHEDDTPRFSFDITTGRIKAWQTAGNTMRTFQNGKVRAVQFTCREFNRRVWNLVEPGTTYTPGANGTVTATIPASGGNPPKAGLVEIFDLDFGIKLLVYVPRLSVTNIGELKPSGSDSMNTQLTLEFEQDTASTPPYYIATNHPGLVTA
jgi:hypothetical protein